MAAIFATERVEMSSGLLYYGLAVVTLGTRRHVAMKPSMHRAYRETMVGPQSAKMLHSKLVSTNIVLLTIVLIKSRQFVDFFTQNCIENFNEAMNGSIVSAAEKWPDQEKKKYANVKFEESPFNIKDNMS